MQRQTNTDSNNNKYGSIFRAKPIQLTIKDNQNNRKIIENPTYSKFQIGNLQNEEVDYSNFLMPELSILKQLEKEHSKRRELIKNPNKKVNLTNYELQKFKNTIISPNKQSVVSVNHNTSLASSNNVSFNSNDQLKKQNKESLKLEIKNYYCFVCKELIENVVKIKN